MWGLHLQDKGIAINDVRARHRISAHSKGKGPGIGADTNGGQVDRYAAGLSLFAPGRTPSRDFATNANRGKNIALHIKDYTFV